MGKTSRDLRNRAVGMTAAMRSRMKERNADDLVISERVRSRIGRVVQHAASITVQAENGVVTLGGDVPGDPVLEAVPAEDPQGTREPFLAVPAFVLDRLVDRRHGESQPVGGQRGG